MVFLRSEEHLGRWLDAHGWEPGAGMTVTMLSRLARRWWSTRLDPNWSPRPLDESQAILDGLGLTGAFWRLG